MAMTITKLTTSIRAAVITYVKKVTAEIREPLVPISDKGTKVLAAIDRHFTGNGFREQILDIMSAALGEQLNAVPEKKHGAMYVRLSGDYTGYPFWYYRKDADPIVAGGQGVTFKDYRIATDAEVDKFFGGMKDNRIVNLACQGSETLYDKIFLESSPPPT